MGKEESGLYILVNSPSTLTSCAAISSQVWHNRLGHVSSDKMQMLSPFIHISDNSQFNCNVCHLANQHRLHFPVSFIKSQKPFDMIHCDIWGKFSVLDYKGFQYFLTVVDDFSRCTWIFLMTHKFETYSLVKHFLILVKT